MKSPLGCRTSVVLALLAAALWPRTSQGQEPPNPGAPNAPAPVPATGGQPATAPATAPSPTPGVVAGPTPPPLAPAPPPGNASSGAVAARKWYDAVKVEGFVDAYAGVNANSPKPQTGQNLGRAFDEAGLASLLREVSA